MTEQAKALFEAVDEDGDGLLSRFEFRAFLDMLGVAPSGGQSKPNCVQASAAPALNAIREFLVTLLRR